jgi:hypothetical protein
MENRNEFRENQYSGNIPTALPNSTAVLVLGILSIFFCFCYGVIGIICGIVSLILYPKDKKLYMENPQAYTLSSYNNLKAGRVCAIIGLILSAIFFAVLVACAIFFGMAFFTNPEHFFNEIH